MRRNRSGILRESQYHRWVAVSQERAAIAIFRRRQMEDGMGGAKIGMTMVGKRAGVIADLMTCFVVEKKYKSTRVQPRNAVRLVGWRDDRR
jgi:hypothetical protein